MDINYLLFLQHIREVTHGAFDTFFIGISALGRTIAPILVISGIFWCINKKIGRYLLLGFSTAKLANIFIKITACVYRPWIQDPRIHPIKGATATATGYSFPSGHTTNAMTYLGGVAYLNSCGKALRITCIGLVLLVMFSRNFLGVHTPQDVLVAFLGTAIILWAIYHVNERASQTTKYDKLILLSGILISIGLYLYATWKNYPLDYDSARQLISTHPSNIKEAYKTAGLSGGIFIGWFVEKSWINFTCEGSWQKRVLRYILCTFGLFVYLDILYPIIKNSIAWNMGLTIACFLEGIYITVIAPLSIKYLLK